MKTGKPRVSPLLQVRLFSEVGRKGNAKYRMRQSREVRVAVVPWSRRGGMVARSCADYLAESCACTSRQAAENSPDSLISFVSQMQHFVHLCKWTSQSEVKNYHSIIADNGVCFTLQYRLPLPTELRCHTHTEKNPPVNLYEHSLSATKYCRPFLYLTVPVLKLTRLEVVYHIFLNRSYL